MSIEIKKIPHNVATKRTDLKAQPSSPPIVPLSNVAIKLCQAPSINPNLSACGSGELLIPKITIETPSKTTINNDEIANHFITPPGPDDMVFSK